MSLIPRSTGLDPFSLGFWDPFDGFPFSTGGNSGSLVPRTSSETAAFTGARSWIPATCSSTASPHTFPVAAHASAAGDHATVSSDTMLTRVEFFWKVVELSPTSSISQCYRYIYI